MFEHMNLSFTAGAGQLTVFKTTEATESLPHRPHLSMGIFSSIVPPAALSSPAGGIDMAYTKVVLSAMSTNLSLKF